MSVPRDFGEKPFNDQKLSAMAKNNQTPYQRTTFWFSILCFLVLLGISLLQPHWISSNNVLFRTLLGLAAGGIAATLPGFLHINLNNVVKAGGALATFTLVFLFNPAMQQSERITLSVFVSSEDGQMDDLLRQNGSVIMTVVGGRREPKVIDERRQAIFSDVRVGDEVKLDVEFSEPFQPIKPDSIYKIDRSGQIDLTVRLLHLERIFGNVSFDEEPLMGVRVYVQDVGVSDTTNAFGDYSIMIPKESQRRKQMVMFLKEGFKPQTLPAYPFTDSRLDLIMLKD